MPSPFSQWPGIALRTRTRKKKQCRKISDGLDTNYAMIRLKLAYPSKRAISQKGRVLAAARLAIPVIQLCGAITSSSSGVKIMVSDTEPPEGLLGCDVSRLLLYRRTRGYSAGGTQYVIALNRVNDRRCGGALFQSRNFVGLCAVYVREG